MKTIVLALCLACGVPVAHAQAVPAAASAPADALTGEYHLEGVMETGSGLRLKPDGTFDWYFTYGALDLGARGKWSRDGDAIVLTVDDMGFPPQMPETKFDRMRLRIDGTDLVPAWPWDMDAFRKGEERGSYVHE
jgi:hypothetical protein